MIPAEKIYTNVFMNWDENGSVCREKFGNERVVPFFIAEGGEHPLYFVKINDADLAMLSKEEFENLYRVTEKPGKDISHSGFQTPTLSPMLKA